jgi:hypothetical protein
MPLPQLANTGSRAGGGIAFLVSAGIVYEIIASNCSSPQTTELNAKDRAGTLMKWVHLGMAQAAFFVLAAAWFDKSHRTPILLGGALAASLMEGLYLHAKACGLASDLPGTEEHSGGGGWWQKGA